LTHFKGFFNFFFWHFESDYKKIVLFDNSNSERVFSVDEWKDIQNFDKISTTGENQQERALETRTGFLQTSHSQREKTPRGRYGLAAYDAPVKKKKKKKKKAKKKKKKNKQATATDNNMVKKDQIEENTTINPWLCNFKSSLSAPNEGHWSTWSIFDRFNVMCNEMHMLCVAVDLPKDDKGYYDYSQLVGKIVIQHAWDAPMPAFKFRVSAPPRHNPKNNKFFVKLEKADSQPYCGHMTVDLIKNIVADTKKNKTLEYSDGVVEKNKTHETGKKPDENNEENNTGKNENEASSGDASSLTSNDAKKSSSSATTLKRSRSEFEEESKEEKNDEQKIRKATNTNSNDSEEAPFDISDPGVFNNALDGEEFARYQEDHTKKTITTNVLLPTVDEIRKNPERVIPKRQKTTTTTTANNSPKCTPKFEKLPETFPPSEKKEESPSVPASKNFMQVFSAFSNLTTTQRGELQTLRNTGEIKTGPDKNLGVDVRGLEIWDPIVISKFLKIKYGETEKIIPPSFYASLDNGKNGIGVHGIARDYVAKMYCNLDPVEGSTEKSEALYFDYSSFDDNKNFELHMRERKTAREDNKNHTTITVGSKHVITEIAGSIVVLDAESFKLSGRQVGTGKKPIFLVKKSKKCQKTAILGQKRTKIEISDLATRKFEKVAGGCCLWGISCCLVL